MNPKTSNSKVDKTTIDAIVEQAVFSTDQALKDTNYRLVREAALKQGAYPASIQALYDAAGKGKYKGFTVAAINIRMLTYPVAQAIFRAALKHKVGAFSFEIARSEIEYTKQPPAEYVFCILAAAIRTGFKGPVFIQGDHYQVRRAMYRENPANELDDIKKLIKQSVEAGFYNIDIDASTLVNISKDDLAAQQEKNSLVTAEMTKYIRSIEPKGVTVSVGGEIGEIGKGNSTVEDLRAFMDEYLKLLPAGMKGISKISVQTGTTHGGVALPDGTIAKVNIAFQTLKEISKTAREEYGLGGAVQHGASTLPDEAFDMFPKVETVEVHLATGFQNIVYDSTSFPKELTQQVHAYLDKNATKEKKEGETQEQFYYNTRKKAFGALKSEMWHMPAANLAAIMGELESRFDLMFHKLNVADTGKIVGKYVKRNK
jgi:fructose/tagatose bisphosphate aldolase